MDSFIRDSSGTRVDTLTIPAIPEYNGTEVVCVATFFDESPSEVTPPANLIVFIINEGMQACRVLRLCCFIFTSLIVTHDSEATTQPPLPTAVTVTVLSGKVYNYCGC